MVTTEALTTLENMFNPGRAMVEPASENSLPPAGAVVLNRVERFLPRRRFVCYPNGADSSRRTLLVHRGRSSYGCGGGSTPRLVFLSPEPGSGKTRALEVTELLVPEPVHAVQATSAYLFRRLGDERGSPRSCSMRLTPYSALK